MKGRNEGRMVRRKEISRKKNGRRGIEVDRKGERRKEGREGGGMVRRQ